MEVKEIKKKVEKTFCADNGKRFSVGTDISFVLADTGRQMYRDYPKN